MTALETDRVVEAAIRLAALIDAHSQDAGRQLGEALQPWLRDGETLPDFTLALQLIARMSREKGHRLRNSEKSLEEATTGEAEARLKRNQTASAVRRKLVDIRRLLALVLDWRRAARLLGIQGDTAKSSQSALLLSQADACLSLLRDPQRLRIPSTRRFFEPSATADELEPLVVSLRQARESFDTSGREERASTRNQEPEASRPQARRPQRRRHRQRLLRAYPANRPGQEDPPHRPARPGMTPRGSEPS